MKKINTEISKKVVTAILAALATCSVMGCSVEKTVTTTETHTVTDADGNTTTTSTQDIDNVDEKNENMDFGMRIIGKKHFGSADHSENDLERLHGIRHQQFDTDAPAAS